MTPVAGRYFEPGRLKPVASFARRVSKRIVRIENRDGKLLHEAPPWRLRASPRLASLRRRIDFHDGARFETDDNDGADALLWRVRMLPRGAFASLLERFWPVTAALGLIALLIGYLFVVRSAPILTEQLAAATFRTMEHPMSEQALLALDRYALHPTNLTAADQAKARALFARVAAFGRRGAGGYRVVFRSGWRIGPNAFALPDGTIVLTDRLWAMIKSPDEIAGVFAHEISHVDHAHQLQRIYGLAFGPAAMATLTGDISQMSAMAANLPGLIAQDAYSEAFERQADDDAAAVVRTLGGRPSRLAALLLRLDHKACTGRNCAASWVSDHDATVARAARLRAEDRGPAPD